MRISDWSSDVCSSDLAGTGSVSNPAIEKKKETVDRTDDPVRMYLREMGAVELLSREGEIAIAKRIEAGRDTMILGLCASLLTFNAIIDWSRSEEHTSVLQSLMRISYAVFFFKKKNVIKYINK